MNQLDAVLVDDLMGVLEKFEKEYKELIDGRVSDVEKTRAEDAVAHFLAGMLVGLLGGDSEKVCELVRRVAQATSSPETGVS